MIIRVIFSIFLFFSVTNYSFSAGTTDTSSKSDYDKAANLIKSAKKYETKKKTKKALKRYEKALKLLIKENKKKPNQANTLNYLGFASRKLGDYENGEKYYLLGLAIDPNHKGINEYLG